MSQAVRHADDQAALGVALQAVRNRFIVVMADAKAAETPMSLPIAQNSALGKVCQAFELSPFETAVLLTTVAVELLPGFDGLCAELAGSPDRGYPTLGMALAVFPEGHWDALLPGGKLRGERLVWIAGGDVLMQRPIRIEERVLHALIGHAEIEPRLARRAVFRPDPGPLPPSHEAVAKSMSRAGDLVHLWADDLGAAVDVAARGAACQGRSAWVMDSTAIPVDAAEREELVRSWARELKLAPTLLVVRHRGENIPGAEAALVDLLVRSRGPWVLVSRDAVPLDLPVIRRRVSPLPFEEKLALWGNALRGTAAVSEAVVRDLSAQFNLGPSAIQSVADDLRTSEATEGRDVRNVLWRACRGHARPRMADLAQRVEVRSRMDRLVLPNAQRDMLEALIGQVRRRATVHHGWGFAELDERSAGTSAVFSGSSGTGKTMAAEAIAAELDLDLYRIDLSAVVSKYIGETEENLRHVFDAAEAGGAILLFDEADALFGKRTEVKDSHDRHANIEVSYLLQRMEAYAGLAILTTNLRKSIDDAFLRRVQFIIEFPFPDAGQREHIWRNIFPGRTPRDDLDFTKLARLSVTGGNIRSIARNAAYIAANHERPVGMTHLLAAARLEYAKLGRSLAPSEIHGWE